VSLLSIFLWALLHVVGGNLVRDRTFWDGALSSVIALVGTSVFSRGTFSKAGASNSRIIVLLFVVLLPLIFSGVCGLSEDYSSGR